MRPFWKLDLRFPIAMIRPVVVLLVAQLISGASGTFALADKPSAAGRDYLRDAYREDAAKCVFASSDGQPLQLVHGPIMRWTNDGDWSGDVYVWTHKQRPAVIGCVLSGPGAGNLRYIYHEFHLLAEQPIAPAVIQNERRWEPSEGLNVERLADAPTPADRASSRLAQMREIARGFKPFMFADGTCELRLLTQPLLRYGNETGEVTDGALFGYVWTKGTDPELILLVECRSDDHELAWCFAPIRFSNRALWLKHNEKEIWRVEAHREPSPKSTSLVYTTAFARSLPSAEKSDAHSPESK